MNPVAFLLEVKAEMSKVIWPTRQQATQLTIVVITVSTIVGIYTGGLDYIFTNLVNALIVR